LQQLEFWPPPEDWTEVQILWDDILGGPEYPIRKILDWIETAVGGEYHLSGLVGTKGFSFRFKNSQDATYFVMMWL